MIDERRVKSDIAEVRSFLTGSESDEFREGYNEALRMLEELLGI